MSIWAIIPVKPLNRAKSRLASVLSANQRYEFATLIYRHVLGVVTNVKQLAGTVVISRDTKALAIAREMGARTIQEGSNSDLNLALRRATELVRAWRGSAVLILPADLPFVTEDDIFKMIEMALGAVSVVIATDPEQDGTNAMLVRPPGLFDYAYGDGSFRKHMEAALAARAYVKVYESPTIALDVDVPQDLGRYNQMVTSGQYSSLTPFLPDLI
ncbi:MAG: 2-phospho-L-lactate guanylyltransferase [Anaerolineae bacterium]|nr:2-phospho-L-lactate guanylyltransferase [Anaerolineae bacterium]MDW8171419.1 2-phospho-L-lactate guanylyltransferase [Anaerolineae bacterium]